MAKVAKPKKRELSVHSRAARRGASPPPIVGAKSTKEETDYNPWLHSAQDAGILKKKKVKQLTRQQKLRQQRGMEKAASDLDKLEKKVADSKQRGKKVKARAVDWEELNVELVDTKETSVKLSIGTTDALETNGAIKEPLKPQASMPTQPAKAVELRPAGDGVLPDDVDEIT